MSHFRGYTFVCLLFIGMIGCGSPTVTPKKNKHLGAKKASIALREPKVVMDSALIQRYATIGLHPIQDERILVDLRYTTPNNFMGHVLYDTIDRLFLQREVLSRLSKCQDLLDSLRPGFRLKVYDGVRPLQVQKEMWDALDSIPVLHRGKYVSNPRFGSVHNFGTAVDITICNHEGQELDMGAGYDDFRPIAFPSKEALFLR